MTENKREKIIKSQLISDVENIYATGDENLGKSNIRRYITRLICCGSKIVYAWYMQAFSCVPNLLHTTYLYNLNTEVLAQSLKKYTYMNLISFFLCFVIIIIYLYQKMHTDYTKLKNIYIHELSYYVSAINQNSQ